MESIRASALFLVATVSLIAACGDSVTTTGAGGGGAGGAGTGGETTMTTTGTGNVRECETDADCKVINDCCSCDAVPNAQMEGICEHPCEQTECSAQGLPDPGAACRQGQCVFSVSCNVNEALCDQLPPNCPDGQSPALDETCFTGCIESKNCIRVTDCNSCGADQICIDDGQLGIHCVPIPEACGAAGSCACMPNVCDTPYDHCADSEDGIVCGCTSCG